MAPTDSLVVETLARFETKLDTLIEDVSAPPRHGEPGGLLFRMREQEDEVKELRKLIIELKTRIDHLETAPGKAALSWWDRVGLALLGLALSGIGALIGTHLKGGH